MSSRQQLLQLYEPEPYEKIRAEVQRRLTDAYQAKLKEVEQDHDETDASTGSPYIEDFERHYLGKVRKGLLTLEQALAKIQESHEKSAVPQSVIDHMKAHIILRVQGPPSKDEIEEEARKEQKRQEEEARKSEKLQKELEKEAKRFLENERLRVIYANLERGERYVSRGRVVTYSQKTGQVYRFRRGHRGRLPTNRAYRQIQASLRKATQKRSSA